MGVDIEKFVILLNDEEQCLSAIKGFLTKMLDAGRRRAGDEVARITPDLVEKQDRMAYLDQELVKIIKASAESLGIAPEAFKLSMIDEGRLTEKLDVLRALSSEIARLSAETAGVLSADIDVIEETVRVLETIDSRSVSYGPAKAPTAAGARILDRSA
jgi:hypothetical protein